MTAGEKKKHHWLPKFYLNQFTCDRDDRGLLHVVDFERQKTYRAAPGGIAYRRFLYKIGGHKGRGPDANSIEDYFGRIESMAAPIIKEMSTSKAVPRGVDLAKLLLFLAAQHARTPAFLELAKDAGKTARLEMSEDEKAITNERLLAKLNKMATEFGVQPIAEVSFDENLETWRQNNLHLMVMMRAIRQYWDTLRAKTWFALDAAKSGAQLVVSDFPLALASAHGVRAALPISMNRDDVDIIFPIGHDLLLGGSSLNSQGRRNIPLCADMVAQSNTIQVLHSREYIFSSRKDITLYFNGKINTCTCEELLDIRKKLPVYKFGDIRSEE